MGRIIVHNQAELDAVPADFGGIVEVRFGTACDPAIIRGRLRAVLWENSRAVLRGNSRAELRENSLAVLWDNSSAELWENSLAVLWDNSRAVLRENSRAVLWENSSAVLWDSSSAELWGKSSAMLWEDSRAVLRENSSAVLRGNSRAELRESSSAVLCGNAQGLDRSMTHNIKTSGNARIVYDPKTIGEYMDYYGLSFGGKTVRLYKAVRKLDGRYFADHDGETEYKIGEITEANGLTTDIFEDCGQGIHMAHLQWALYYGRDWDDLAILEVEADADGIIVPLNGCGKVRAAKVKTIREVPLEECGIIGEIILRRRKCNEKD